jgi:hypothetical protein
VDAVVDLGEGALEVPAKLQAVVFLVLEALKLFDEVQLEFDGDPGGELEGDVLMGVGTAVTASTGNKPRGAGRINPTFGGQDEAVQPACFLVPSNSMGLKPGLFSCSQTPRNSMVLRLRIQFGRPAAYPLM